MYKEARNLHNLHKHNLYKCKKKSVLQTGCKIDHLRLRGK